MNNKKRALIIVSSILILITIIGLSYAYFAANIIGNEEVSSIAGRAAYLEVTFADGADTITGNNIVPGWSASKTFTVTNTGENKTYYNLKVVNITNTFTIPGSISLSISSNDGGKNVEKMVLPASDEVIARSIPIELNGVHHYTVTAYYNNLDVDQIDDLNKTFSFDITIENAQKAEPQGWSTAPEGSLLAGIKKNNSEAGNIWTVPGRQVSTPGNSTDIRVNTEQSAYYWTYGDGYTINNNKFDLTNPSTCVYSSCYLDLVGKYLVGTTIPNNSDSTDTMKTTTGLTLIYKVIYSTPSNIIVEKYDYLGRGTSSSYKYWTYGTGAESASTTTYARYNLTGVNIIDYDEEYDKLIGNYLSSEFLPYISSASPTITKTTTNLSNLFEVVDATPEYIIYKSATESTLGETEDDYGTSYYYRGAVDNNYIAFANMCWRIVRIDGKGNIKLTLYNYNPTNATNPCDISLDGETMAYSRLTVGDVESYTSAFNSVDKYNSNIGYMYSNNPNSTDFNLAHANDADSTILTNLKAWYDLVFSQSDKDKLADVIWCNDKRPVSDTAYNPDNISLVIGTGIGQAPTYYQSLKRLRPFSEAVPSLKCGTSKTDNLISKFTASTLTDGGFGNGKLNGYKIGLLTADEISFAGATYGAINNTYYLHKNTNNELISAPNKNSYWTLSPVSCNDNGVANLIVFNGNIRRYVYSSSFYSVRPAISLKSNTTISGGNGTQSNPFVVS